MPSHRKRIGFLPSEEVHVIIEEISKDNNYSQSKVTGILVEEALKSRGYLNRSFSKNSSLINDRLDNANKNNLISLNNYLSNNLDFSIKNNKSLTEDIKLINDFIEYKLFKKIMKQNDNINT